MSARIEQNVDIFMDGLAYSANNDIEQYLVISQGENLMKVKFIVFNYFLHFGIGFSLQAESFI